MGPSPHEEQGANNITRELTECVLLQGHAPVVQRVEFTGSDPERTNTPAHGVPLRTFGQGLQRRPLGMALNFPHSGQLTQSVVETLSWPAAGAGWSFSHAS